MRKQVPEHLGAHDLVNPDLVPSFSLQIDVAEEIFSLVRVKREQGTAQRRSAPAEQKTIYMRRAHGVRNESGNLVCGKLNRIFVVHTPVDPLLVIDL